MSSAEGRVPSLRRSYRASPVLRTRPPLCLASVLGSLGGRALQVSLGIEETGSHVPHKSLSPVSRRLDTGRRPASRQASAELRPKRKVAPGFDNIPRLSTRHRRFTHVRLTGAHLTGSHPPFPATLTTPAVSPGRLAAVWTLILQSEPEGPALISCAARLPGVDRYMIPSSRRRGALQSAKRESGRLPATTSQAERLP